MNCCPAHSTHKIARSIAVKIAENEKFVTAYRKSHPIKTAMPMELRTRVWNKFIENSDPIVEKYAVDVKKYFNKQMKAAIAILPRTFNKAELKKWVKALTAVNKEHITIGFVTGGTQAISDARDLVKPKKDIISKQDIDDFDIGSAEAVSYIKGKSLASSIEVNKTTMKKLTGSIAAGIAAEESIDEISKRVETIFAQATRSRAVIIAQTETVGAVNKGTIEGSKQSGVVWGHQWVGSLDNVIRETHEQMTLDEDTAKIGSTFSNGGEYPGGSGIAEEDINCLIADARIMIPNSLKGMTRRRYAGDLITITTAGGVEFTATPNHPVLTSDGWVALKFVKMGNDIICAPLSKEMSFGNPNKKNIPMSIEEIFSLSIVMGEVKRIPTMKNQFHGEGNRTVAKDIDVITVNSILQSAIKSSVLNPAEQKCFAGSNSDKGFLMANSSFAHLGISSFHSPHSSMSGSGKSLPVLRGSLGHSQEHAFTSVAGLDTCFEESVSDNITGNIEMFSQSLLGCSVDVSVDNIISINRRHFVGHVYNLQTENGWYIANNNNISNGKGIVNHNCRCTMFQLTEKP